MGYVDRFIKKISLENTNYKETRLPDLKPGDIVWAKRYSKEEVRENIDLEHQEGPFIVIYKNELNISYCLECSSKEETKNKNIIMFDKKYYPRILYRDTYVKLKSDIELTSYRYIRKLGSLIVNDFNLLKKTLFLLMTDEENAKLFSFQKNKLNFYLDSGDFIRKDGDHYLVGYKEGNTLYSYRAIKDEFNSDIIINNLPFKIRYDKKKKISASDTYMLLGIYHKYKSYLKKTKVTGYTKADIGNLVKINSNIYLIHGKYKKYLVGIQVYTNKNKNATYKIDISNKEYQTNYNFFLLPEEYEYNIISNILEFEICEYLEKIEKLNIKPNLSKDNIISVDNSSNLYLSSLQEEIISNLNNKDFTFEEIIGIMIALKDISNQLKFKDYLIRNYNQKDKEIIKNALIYIITYGEFKNDLYLKEGDIIIAKRDNDPIFKNNIAKDTSKTGPYIILHIDKEQNIIYAMTGLYSFSGVSKTIFKVSPKNNEMLEENTIRIKNTNPIELRKQDYIKKIDELSKEELNTFTKKVYSKLYFDDTQSPVKKEVLKYYNSIYDIVNYKNGYYLIYDEDENYFFSYQVCATSKFPYFKINDIGYMVNLANTTKLPKEKTYEIVRILDKDKFDVIKKKKRWVNLESLQLTNNIISKRGDIFKFNHNTYLIYGEYKNYYQLYLLSLKKKQNNIYKIIINNSIYYTSFDTYLISKDKKIAIIQNIEEQLNNINNQKKLLNINSNTFSKPIDYIEEKSITLNQEQLLLIAKLKEYNFSSKGIIGILIAMNYKFAVDEMLDFIIKKEQNKTINKHKIIQRVLEIIRNEL